MPYVQVDSVHGPEVSEVLDQTVGPDGTEVRHDASPLSAGYLPASKESFYVAGFITASGWFHLRPGGFTGSGALWRVFAKHGPRVVPALLPLRAGR
ncbi:hypothetical protein GCM10009555_059930 [Acrocarpospora macrocephala]|uniref:Uncharacterized protein n=1 Tax=Acrocarpospora macrocephala TaxID=150177 RepID=A0A5M3WS54_9ACTN|nr:hypothetical protein Amac_037380 [Acrocarpospora macrocephala]